MKKESKASATLPKEHWEKTSDLPLSGTGKYSSSEMGNPEDLKQSVEKLESYTKSHKAPH